MALSASLIFPLPLIPLTTTFKLQNTTDIYIFHAPWVNEYGFARSISIDRTAALFAESTGRLLASVGREDDVKIVGLCESRGIPALRKGIANGASTAEIQAIANWNLAKLGAAHKALWLSNLCLTPKETEKLSLFRAKRQVTPRQSQT